MNKLTKFLHKWRLEPSLFSVSLYSTQTQTTSSPRLYQRLQKCNEVRASVVPVLDEWVARGRKMHRLELVRFIKAFRKSNRIKPALEISEWMSRNMEDFTVTPGHAAIQLDLISKVRGLEEAEKFFNGLEDGLKDVRVYAALLNCYAGAKSVEKAEATMEKIREFECSSNLSYNTMMSLYSKMGMHDKMDLMMREMESMFIDFSSATYNIKLNVYAANSDLEGMEKLLAKVEADPQVPDKFQSYCIAAKGYINAGDLEKALALVRKAEGKIEPRQRRFAYGPLISLYANMQKREEVYRVWSLLRMRGNLQYQPYAYVIPALEKLGDLDGAKKILEEWEGENANSDVRVPNLLIGAFCRRGDIGEAEVIVKRVVEGGRKPCPKTWSHMALGYLKSGRMEEAVETAKKACMSASSGWKPDHAAQATMSACLEYLEKKGDQKGRGELLVLVEKYASVSSDLS